METNPPWTTCGCLSGGGGGGGGWGGGARVRGPCEGGRGRGHNKNKENKPHTQCSHPRSAPRDSTSVRLGK